VLDDADWGIRIEKALDRTVVDSVEVEAPVKTTCSLA
jgi:hypothetical protein